MRLVARHLRSTSRANALHGSAGSGAGAGGLLAEHHAALDRRLASSFFFTGPMWVGWTRPKIEGWLRWIGWWPVVGMVGAFGEGYVGLVDEYYYCESRRGAGLGLGVGLV
jgi:peroxin-16